GERRNVAALTLLAAGIGIGLSGLLSPVMAIVALCVAAVGFIAPILRVKAETLFASDAAGLLTLAAVAVIGSLII
ncbi:MFS transporter, partial [Escherichia coli]|nr:MFS transporter [Escherichia coli]